ncbi:MAG TPA: pyruvate kinase [Bacteroidales bacterium]|nr:pyruvate kinase [Bacteroidales bacterium]
MHTFRSRTKIVVTIGPASSGEEVLQSLMREGVDVFRLNFSHGAHSQQLENIEKIKRLRSTQTRNIAILGDLQGPKIRVGEIQDEPVLLKEGERIELTTEDVPGTAQKVQVRYAALAREVKAGETILLDDGKLKLEVQETDGGKSIFCKIIYGGELYSRKGVNLPDSDLSLPSLTDKDVQDVVFMLDNDIDWIALSFVRKAEDVVRLKELILSRGKNVKVIAKIEKPEAVRNIDSILEVADGIMVARGDLGVEMPFHQIPLIQKEIVQKCLRKARPVIIATQMLESMIGNFRPTRAEANDVANAVLDGADALMLSGETSVGKFPVEAATAMQRIISHTEANAYGFHKGAQPKSSDPDFLPKSIAYNAQKMAEQSDARALISFTHTGFTVLQVSRYRPRARLFAFTASEVIRRQLALVWGVEAFTFEMAQSTDQFFDATDHFLITNGYIELEDIVVHIGSLPVYQKKGTNMIKLSRIEKASDKA